ncbi:flagellar biosynthesis anti-sigma factor FlgM [Clostridium sp. D2Q-11]|uniref:Negative regulator of flagellin synthesis n=1 Tax=Anaeromonas frigoriresistens TaxID=2683708 RepID=A0A942UVA6_9FIRM|nr:flagellar biosynthesis anti-sigma factor FlgM [Anaeromonas frigoriresistens]MBS4538150.1 flagellar biosynthesis anti-sigma factor FlgM [Anaeromonas frigoriresistens]
MKIFNNNNIKNIMKAYDNKDKKEVSENSRLKKKDEFTISDEAKDIQKALKVAKDSPDIREEKIREIKMKVDSGNYSIDPKKVAEKIIEDINSRK